MFCFMFCSFVKKILQLFRFCLGKRERVVKLLLYFISMKIGNVYDSSIKKVFLNNNLRSVYLNNKTEY